MVTIVSVPIEASRAAIGTPGEIVERGRVALHDARTLTTLNFPHAQGVSRPPLIR